MVQNQNIPRKIILLSHPNLPDSIEESHLLADVLQKNQVEVFFASSYTDETLVKQVRSRKFDLLIALGGDGTVLRASRLCASAGLPMLGVNVGNFGFLTEVQRTGWREVLPRLLAGDYRLEERMMLHISHLRRGKILDEWEVLNEVVVCRGEMVRPVNLVARVEGYTLASYVADGLIASTPTGSTAYALAVDGPVLPPELRNILLVPIAPHMSFDRAIVLSEGAEVNITVQTRHDAVLSADGQPPVKVVNGDEVLVKASAHPARFIRFQDPGYFYRTLNQYTEQTPRTYGDT